MDRVSDDLKNLEKSWEMKPMQISRKKELFGNVSKYDFDDTL